MDAYASKTPDSLTPHHIERSSSAPSEAGTSKPPIPTPIPSGNQQKPSSQPFVGHPSDGPYVKAGNTCLVDACQPYPLSSQISAGSSSNQSYCFIPVPSGLMHPPFVLQCVPLVSPLPTSPLLRRAHYGECTSNSGSPSGCLPMPINCSLPSPATVGGTTAVDADSQVGLDTIASALTQMKASSFAICPAPGTQGDAPSTGRSNEVLCCVDVPENSPHEKPRPHLCKMKDNWGHLCKRTFTRPYDLQRHQETVHGSATKSFCCDECGCKSKSFSRQDSLARHIRRMHRPATPGYSCPVVVSTREDEDDKRGSVECAAASILEATSSPSRGRSGSTDCKDENDGSSGPERKRIKIEHLLTAQMV